MFARNVSIRLKPNCAAEFSKTLDNEVIPLLYNQNGFQGEITSVAPGGLEAVSISLWDEKKDADAYDHGKYPEVRKVLMNVLAGPPQIRTYEVSNSTFHGIAAPVEA
jgi:hypothetical protein